MISDHDKTALGHTRILEFHKFYSEYHLWLQADDERFRVTIRIYETNDGRFFFTQSHYVRTPLHDGSASPTRLTHMTSQAALSAGAESVTSFYEAAVGQGHTPSTDWFVPNPRF